MWRQAFTFKGRERSIWDWWNIFQKKNQLVIVPEGEGGTDKPDQTYVCGDASADAWDRTADQQVGANLEQPMSEPSLDPLGADDEEDVPAFPYDADEEEGNIEKEVMS